MAESDDDYESAMSRQRGQGRNKFRSERDDGMPMAAMNGAGGSMAGNSSEHPSPYYGGSGPPFNQHQGYSNTHHHHGSKMGNLKRKERDYPHAVAPYDAAGPRHHRGPAPYDGVGDIEPDMVDYRDSYPHASHNMHRHALPPNRQAHTS
jgi:hypothetical protein